MNQTSYDYFENSVWNNPPYEPYGDDEPFTPSESDWEALRALDEQKCKKPSPSPSNGAGGNPEKPSKKTLSYALSMFNLGITDDEIQFNYLEHTNKTITGDVICIVHYLRELESVNAKTCKDITKYKSLFPKAGDCRKSFYSWFYRKINEYFAFARAFYRSLEMQN